MRCVGEFNYYISNCESPHPTRPSRSLINFQIESIHIIHGCSFWKKKKKKNLFTFQSVHSSTAGQTTSKHSLFPFTVKLKKLL